MMAHVGRHLHMRVPALRGEIGKLPGIEAQERRDRARLSVTRDALAFRPGLQCSDLETGLRRDRCIADAGAALGLAKDVAKIVFEHGIVRSPRSGTNMRALWLTGHRGPESFEVRESSDPSPAAGQVRIRVRATGLNFADLLASQGLYPDAPRLPCVLGYEAAGIVDAAGEGVDAGLIGRRVMVMTKFGGHADTLCIMAALAFPIPDAMTFEEAAAIPVNYGTAYHMLHRIACVRRARCLVHALPCALSSSRCGFVSCS